MRTPNRSLLKVATGFAAVVAFVFIASLLSEPADAGRDSVVIPTTTTKPATTSTTAIESQVESETATSAQVIAMTSGNLKFAVKDILDTTTCDDLVFDFELFINNYTTKPNGERILDRASELTARNIGCDSYPVAP